MRVELQRLGARDWWKAIGVGIATAVVLAGLNIIALKSRVSPLPQPLGLAFAETVFGKRLPLPVGLLFHTVWVTAFAVAYVSFRRDSPTLTSAFALAGGLWLLVLCVFFPIVGWGFLGLAVGLKLSVPVTVSHLLFALILWSLCRFAFGRAGARRPTQPQEA